MRIAEVVFNLPLERAFHYLIPPALESTAQPGARVLAPFGSTSRIGFVVKRVSKSSFPMLKTVRRVLDSRPVIADERWALAEWLSRHYCCSFGEALAALIPGELRIRWSAAADARVEKCDGSVDGHAPTLTPHQQRAFEVIEGALQRRRTSTILLHGVTGSGKTELYLRAIASVLQRGDSAICLVPEIALTPQTIDRFQARFGACVAVWHSRLTRRQRAQVWQEAVSGARRIVIGTRSAVFSPLPRVGLIVVDEEHESTYKQGDTPRYHARDVAQARMGLTRGVVLLGSATPSVESYYEAAQGRSQLVELPERIAGRRLPSVDIVDMRDEFGARRAGLLSRRLQRALERAVQRQEQAMLLLNRRGFARVAQCRQCGTVMRCRRCAVTMVYHASQQQLVCHYCNFQTALPDICGACRKGVLRLRGIGTERVESELHRLFPVASISRMDSDTTKSRESHRQLYDAIKTEQVGLLVGTQMIAKGLDFPQVTLVGVVSADTALNLPDFRAGERTFDLLTQVAGRAGRGAQPGQVVIQTYCPAHYAIRAATRHDYAAFYAEEIQMRKRLNLPPWTHLVELTIHGTSHARVSEAAEGLAKALRRRIATRRMALLGPAPHRIPKLRRSFRMSVIVKGRTVAPMVELLRSVLQPGRRAHGLPVTVDVDPL